MKRGARFTLTTLLLVTAGACGSNAATTNQPDSTIDATVPVTEAQPVLPSVEGPLIREMHPRPEGNYDTLLSELAGTVVLRNNCVYIEHPDGDLTTLLIYLYGTTWDPATQAIGTFTHVGDTWVTGGVWYDPDREWLDRILDDEGLAAVDRCTAEGGITVAIW